MKTRKATLEDVEAVSQIVCLCYEDFGRTDDYSNEAIEELKESRGSVKCLRELMVNEDVFVADDGECIKGMASVKSNEITKLYVHPDYQRKGVGEQLFTQAEAFIQSHGYHDMFLGAAALTSVPFYERMGMRITRERTIDRGPCIGMTSITLEKVL